MSRQLVEAWFDAFRNRDISKLELAEDFVHTSPFGEIRGRDVYLNLVRENVDAFFSNPIEILDVLDDGDKFAVRYLKEFPRQPAQGFKIQIGILGSLSFWNSRWR